MYGTARSAYHQRERAGRSCSVTTRSGSPRLSGVATLIALPRPYYPVAQDSNRVGRRVSCGASPDPRRADMREVRRPAILIALLLFPAPAASAGAGGTSAGAPTGGASVDPN